MLKVGIAGLGFMGWIHWLAYQKTEGVEVAAICTQEKHRLEGDWTDIKGNFGPPGVKVDLSNIATYQNLDEMLDNNSLDYIDICLPPALHVDVICRAAAAGKHVFCEKPLALNLAECDRAVEHCKNHDRILMVGQVLPFFPEYNYARSVIDSGKYGKLLGGNFKRVISDPTWLKNFYDPDKIGGPLFDLHVHDAHFIRLLFGMPDGLYSVGRIRGSVVDYCNTVFDYGQSNYTVNCTSGVINQQGRPFTHGYEIHLEECTLQFEFAGLVDGGELMTPKLLTADGKIIRPELGDSDPVRAFEAEIQEVVQAIQNGQPSALLSGRLARDAIQLCQAQSESVKQRSYVAISNN